MVVRAQPSTKDIECVCKYWNKKDIIRHRIFNDKAKRKIKTVLKDYTLDEVLKAIFNYSIILKDNGYFWTYRWTLHDFLQRGLEKFMDEAMPYENFHSKYPVDPDRVAKQKVVSNSYKDRFAVWQKATPEERRKLEEEWKGEMK